jgi:hypothetical protein
LSCSFAAHSSVPHRVVSRPRLKEGLVPLWRDDSTIQIGLDECRATVVGDVSPAAAAALRLLDGSRSREEIEQAGGLAARTLLALLQDSGLLTDAADTAPNQEFDADAQRRCAPEIAALALRSPDPREGYGLFAARRTRRVLIRGAGRVGTSVAHLLAASGVGRVSTEDESRVRPGDVCPGAASAADVGLRRGAAATALSVRALPPALCAGKPDIALICEEGPIPPPPETWSDLVEGGTAVLPVLIRESTAVVGPLIVPSELATSGCPWCVDRHRAERDPQWPLLSDQLRSAGAPGPPAAPLVWAAAALATNQSLELLDRLAQSRSPADHERPVASLGATLELSADCWNWRRRWWGRHSACVCQAPDGARSRPARVAVPGP